MDVNIELRCRMFFFFKQKTAYEMRISDWSSDVCSSDLTSTLPRNLHVRMCKMAGSKIAAAFACLLAIFVSACSDGETPSAGEEIGRASCRERVCQYV